MSGEAHRLVSIVTSFTDPGYYAECACGWRSEARESLPEAAYEYRKHQADDDAEPSRESGGSQ